MPPFIIDMNKPKPFKKWAFIKFCQLTQVVVYGLAFGFAVNSTTGTFF